MNPDQPPQSAGNPPALPPAKTSALAVVSLVFGILGCTFFGAIAGLVCGIIAKVRISNSGGRLKGDGLALAGIIVSSVMLVFSIPFLAGMTLPALAKAKAKAQTITSVNNLKQIALAARIHSANHNDEFPPAAGWVETLRPNLGANAEKILHRPAEGPGSECGYGYNQAVAGMAGKSVNPQTVLFFELQTPQCDAAGGEELLREPKYNGDLVVVAFADGSVHQFRQNALPQLRWKP